MVVVSAQYAFLLLAVAAVACAENNEGEHDQTTAEQFYATYGYYPSWYSNMYMATPILRQAQVKTIADAPVFRTAGINTINTLGYTGYPYTSWPYTGYYNYPMTYRYL